MQDIINRYLAEHLHIVCFDIPFPPGHGGYTDLFYKIKWLHKLGVEIHLHCFSGGLPAQPELEELCHTVRYYKRRRFDFSLRVPYIVSTRRSAELLNELQKDDFPILLEGVHSTWWLVNGKLNGRKVFVRLHNAEYIYYHHLAIHESNSVKRVFFQRESRLLYKWEQKLMQTGAQFLTVSRRDTAIFKTMNPQAEVRFLPVFTGYQTPLAHKGSGEYCVYHGNLSVNENEAAAVWLIDKVFSRLKINLMIAGKNPSHKLLRRAAAYPNVHVIANPSESVMNELMSRAHVHVLPAFNATGVKLKVLNALYLGRFVLANRNAIEGTSVEELCLLAENAEEYISKISELMKEAYSESDIRNRYETLEGIYNNEMNALHLIALIFRHYPKPSRSPF